MNRVTVHELYRLVIHHEAYAILGIPRDRWHELTTNLHRVLEFTDAQWAKLQKVPRCKRCSRGLYEPKSPYCYLHLNAGKMKPMPAADAGDKDHRNPYERDPRFETWGIAFSEDPKDEFPKEP